MRRLVSPDPETTAALGARVAARLFDGAVVLLSGDLGAGKTCFSQGLARGLGVEGPVQSPTYVLVMEYPEARVPLRHADLYRLDRVEEAVALGLEERVGYDGAWVIEWSDRFPDLWPDDRLELRFSHPPAAEPSGGRVIEAVATGPRHAALLEAFAPTGEVA